MEEIKTSVPRFVAMLWKIVTSESCCQWVDGNMFGITNEKQFINILSKYFKHSNFSSFRRQLSLYGFRQSKPGHMIWGHQNFNKYNIKLLSNLKRKLKI
jgi:heat shock transcription factor